MKLTELSNLLKRDIVVAADKRPKLNIRFNEAPWFKGEKPRVPDRPRGIAADFGGLGSYEYVPEDTIEKIREAYQGIFSERFDLIDKNVIKIESLLNHYADADGYVKLGYSGEVTQEEINDLIAIRNYLEYERWYLEEVSSQINPHFEDLMRKLELPGMKK